MGKPKFHDLLVEYDDLMANFRMINFLPKYLRDVTELNDYKGIVKAKTHLKAKIDKQIKYITILRSSAQSMMSFPLLSQITLKKSLRDVNVDLKTYIAAFNKFSAM